MERRRVGETKRVRECRERGREGRIWGEM